MTESRERKGRMKKKESKNSSLTSLIDQPADHLIFPLRVF